MIKHEFLLGEMFPEDDEIARFVIGLSICLNDMSLAADLLMEELEKSDDQELIEPTYRMHYFFKLLSSYLREGIKYLDDSLKRQSINGVYI